MKRVRVKKYRCAGAVTDGSTGSNVKPVTVTKSVAQMMKRPLIAVLFVLVVLVLVNPGVMAASAVAESDVKAVQLVIKNQITALKIGDYQSAYSFAAPNVKQAFPSVQTFTSMVKNGYKPLYQYSTYVFGKNTLSKGEVYQELIVADETRQLWQFIYTLSQQQDKSWKVTNVVMYPFKGTAV